MMGMASAINRPPLRGFRNRGRGISLGINVQQLDSAVESSHREISEPSLDALRCLVIHFAGKDECPSCRFCLEGFQRPTVLITPVARLKAIADYVTSDGTEKAKAGANRHEADHRPPGAL